MASTRIFNITIVLSMVDYLYDYLLEEIADIKTLVNFWVGRVGWWFGLEVGK